MLRKQKLGATTTVTFSIPAIIKASTVTVVGEFNGWNETATPLNKTTDGWTITLDLPRGHEYQYRYLADGHVWMNDWNADYYVPNALGGDDSVVRT